MPIWDSRQMDLDIDAVLRGQGAEPCVIRKRNPQLVDIAQRALEETMPLLEPRTIFQDLEVEKFRHEQLLLDGGSRLSGKLIAEHLRPAVRVIVILCTIGEALEEYATRVASEDIVYSLALDGVGSAAVELLANNACRYFEEQALETGMQTSIPLSPGMMGWSVEVGQPEVFKILQPSQVGVRLSEFGLMIPRKSLTMVLGLGETMSAGGRTCDYCAMRETCRYQDHYDPALA